MKKLMTIGLLVLGFSGTAQAGLMIEPYLGYASGSQKIETIIGDEEWSVTGTVLGARIGYQFVLPWVALDYAMSMGDLKAEGKGTTADTDFAMSSLGVVVGVDLPIVRVFGGYGFNNTIKDDDDKVEGTYTKLGVGFTALPFVSLNLEYIMNDYTKINGDSLGAGVDKVGGNMMLFSVSLPLDL